MDSKMLIEIVGVLKDCSFHVAKSIAEGLKQQFPAAFLDPEIRPLFEFEWHGYLCDKKRELRGEVWQYSSSLMCFLNGRLLGDEKDLASWAENQWGFTFARPQAFYTILAEEYYIEHLQKTGHQFVFMDVEIAGEPAGRLMFELFSDICPKTSKNFEGLCTGEQGLSQSGFPLCYKGSLFHRIVPNGWVQGGGTHVLKKIYIYNNFAISHSKRGILGMANKGAHSNGSQFYITLQPTPWMDKTYVAFGQVVEGLDVLRRLEEAPTCNERPKYECRIIACGVLKPELISFNH
uniref:Peptidyl-prolyl cis-trans isomerase n=1 Tax=Neolamprologus brichardi TaxID=32507 RepID=A0A3Q4N2E1_NEOBR